MIFRILSKHTGVCHHQQHFTNKSQDVQNELHHAMYYSYSSALSGARRIMSWGKKHMNSGAQSSWLHICDATDKTVERHAAHMSHEFCLNLWFCSSVELKEFRWQSVIWGLVHRHTGAFKISYIPTKFKNAMHLIINKGCTKMSLKQKRNHQHQQ